ncbi:hypothetical protein [Mesobacillus thioparans]|uniref:hypothetical protein n=1 Tax=Mesobacillus thioparans TaxID=370439 RepID=UPI0039EF6B8F
MGLSRLSSKGGSFFMFNTGKKPQKYQINGFKFFQSALESLKQEVYQCELNRHPLNASAVAVYIGLVSEVKSAAGLLDVGFRLSDLASKLHLPVSTNSNGYHQLLDRGLIRERVIGSQTQIEITGYAENNRTREESGGRSSGLNYFFVSEALFETTVIAQLVSATSAKGLILLLELFNSFHRDFPKGKESLRDVKDELKMSTLKTKLGLPSATRVRKVVDILSPLFSFTPVGLKERKPRELITRVRKAVTQLWIHKYEIHINPCCVIEKKTTTEPEALKALKDAEYRLRDLNVPLFQSDRVGIIKAYRSIVGEIAQFVRNPKEKVKLFRESMQFALEQLETFVSTQPGELKSVGAFLNDRFQKYVIQFLDNQSGSGLVLDMATTYSSTGAEEPWIWKKYQDYKEKLA